MASQMVRGRVRSRVRGRVRGTCVASQIVSKAAKCFLTFSGPYLVGGVVRGEY